MTWYGLGYAVARGKQAGQDGCCSNASRCESERFFAEHGIATVPSASVLSFETNIARSSWGQDKKMAVNVAKDGATLDAFGAQVRCTHCICT
jgi:hypothetical protein